MSQTSTRSIHPLRPHNAQNYRSFPRAPTCDQLLDEWQGLVPPQFLPWFHKPNFVCHFLHRDKTTIHPWCQYIFYRCGLRQVHPLLTRFLFSIPPGRSWNPMHKRFRSDHPKIFSRSIPPGRTLKTFLPQKSIRVPIYLLTFLLRYPAVQNLLDDSANPLRTNE